MEAGRLSRLCSEGKSPKRTTHHKELPLLPGQVMWNQGHRLGLRFGLLPHTSSHSMAEQWSNTAQRSKFGARTCLVLKGAVSRRPGRRSSRAPPSSPKKSIGAWLKAVMSGKPR